MISSKLPKEELQETLQGLKRLLEVNEQEYHSKKAQYEQLLEELSGLGSSIKNLRGSVAAVERALGIAPVQPEKPTEPAPMKDGSGGETVDASRFVMGIVANHNDSGGITFDEVFEAVKGQKLDVSREYLHTILNRKKNHQKKLSKADGRWFLTEKGKEELGIK
jgi:hypothetical protein